MGVNGAASAGEAACQAVGGSLATGFDSVTSPRLLEVLLGAPGDHGCAWIGLSDAATATIPN